jgi:DNA mismatch endonuclease (patch repair protein)
MSDNVSPEVRSRMMAGIRGKDTKPEMLVRHMLHESGFRYRLHRKDLPGKPDIVLPKYSAVILVHGCFWHGHDCRFFKLPDTRTDWWADKLDQNRIRDLRNMQGLRDAGWRVLIVWECAMRDPGAIPPDRLVSMISTWLRSRRRMKELRGVG